MVYKQYKNLEKITIYFFVIWPYHNLVYKFSIGTFDPLKFALK